MTIQNCFRKVGFAVLYEVTDELEEDVPIPEGMTTEEFERTVNMDEDLEVVGELDDIDLLQKVREKRLKVNKSVR